MNWAILHVVAVVYLVNDGVRGQKSVSPLLSVRPDRAVALHLARQMTWTKENQNLQKFHDVTNIIQYLIADAQKQGCFNCSGCVRDLLIFGQEIIKRDSHAYPVLDSAGKLESGFLLGNLRWYGRYYQCLNSNTSGSSWKWCGAFVGAKEDIYEGVALGLVLGTCIPDSCSEQYITERLQPLANKTNIRMTVTCPAQPSDWSSTDTLSMLIFLILVGLLILGSITGMVIEYYRNQETKSLSVNSDGILAESVYLRVRQRQTAFSKAAVCFSICENTKRLLDVSSKPGTIDALHGLRFFSICWVILGHSYLMPMLYMENVLDLANWYLEQFSFQTLASAFFAVDSFFFLSGVLVTYLALREMAKRNGKLNILLMYIHRYMRITPTYAFLILLVVGSYSKFGNGPNWPALVENQKEACTKYWWTNLLYINNFHPTQFQDECMAWGWYLANDMQFFLLAPVAIVLLYRFPKAGISVLLFGIISSMIVTGVISSHYEEQPNAVGIAQLLSLAIHGVAPSHQGLKAVGMPVGLNMTGTDAFWSDMYAKPWCRIGPYLVGMITGFLLYDTNCKIKMSKLCVTFGWVLAAFLNLSVVYGLWGYVKEGAPMAVSLAAFYNAISRTVWSISLAWVTIACACGYGGPINSFLSWKVFVPLSRLTFSVYLVHPLIIFLVSSSREIGINFSNLDFAVYFIGFTVLSHAAAYVLYVLVEIPIVRLQKVIFVHRKEEEEEPTMSDIDRSLLSSQEIPDNNEEE